MTFIGRGTRRPARDLRPAAKVIAVDVGHGQFDPRLAADPRLRSLQGVDARALTAEMIGEHPDAIVIDVSFISLKLVLPAMLALAARPTRVVALIKPQFEAPRRQIKKGIVRDAAVHAAVCAEIAEFAAALGARDIAVIPSPIEGQDGNREFFIGAACG